MRRPLSLLFLLLSPLAAALAACATAPASPASPASAAAPAPVSEPAPPATMKAVRIHGHGGLDMLRYEEVPRPSPGPGELLVRVHAAGVNPVDWAVREGYLRDIMKVPLPMTLGWDVSGVVVQAGEKTSRFKAGDEVFAYLGLARSGGYAEYAVVPEDAAAPKPRKLDHIQAAGVPLTALTAWQALIDIAKLERGQTVLIHAGSGGVGTMAIQLAKERGARVIATASAQNQELIKSLGADQAIDYQATRFEDVVKDVDVVLDPIGRDTRDRSWKVMKKGGILVSIMGEPSQEAAREHGVRAIWFIVQPNAGELAEISRLIDAGKVRPVIGEVLPLKDAARAHELSQTRHPRGKLVLRVVE